jgi:hypothetical protein
VKVSNGLVVFTTDVVKTRMQKQVVHAGKEPKVCCLFESTQIYNIVTQ